MSLPQTLAAVESYLDARKVLHPSGPRFATEADAIAMREIAVELGLVHPVTL